MSNLTYVIPVYNGARSITHAISSILGQLGSSSKLIVVDDGSTDETLSVVSAYKDRLVLLQQSNLGPSAARNRGLQAVETEAVCFVDADDYVIGPHYQAITNIWNEGTDMIIGLAAEADETVVFVLSNRNKYRLNSSSRDLLRDFICDKCVQTSTICWSTTFLRKIGGWNEALFGIEDIELAMRAFLHDPRVVISNAPGWVVWYQHSRDGSLSKTFDLARGKPAFLFHRNLIGLIERNGCDHIRFDFLFRDA